MKFLSALKSGVAALTLLASVPIVRAQDDQYVDI
jgi:hypothetical protein